MKQSVLLSSAYLPPVQWFTKLMVYENVFVEQCDHYIKQTYRNRCVIATQAGVQALTIPVTLPGNKCPMRDVKISEHGNWRHLHRLSLVSAYENSPFFEFYADDLLPFYEKSYEFLIDFNQELTAKICELLDIDYNAVLTKECLTNFVCGKRHLAYSSLNSRQTATDTNSHRIPASSAAPHESPAQ